MIKHVNFTGRRRIKQACADVTIHNGPPRTFDAVIDLTETSMPASARIYLEAMCSGSSVVQRFAFGTVDNLTPPPTRVLDKVDGDRVFFALKVVDESEQAGRILGLAENIHPQLSDKSTDPGRRGILPIMPAPLGQELWRIDFDGPEVCLLVNEDVHNLKDRMRWDSLLQAAVYPTAMRIILSEAFERGASDDDEDDGAWPSRWMKFARSFHPERTPRPSSDLPDDCHDWVNEVVSEFAGRHSFTDHFRQWLQQQDGEEA